jgi:hypothetical protein
MTANTQIAARKRISLGSVCKAAAVVAIVGMTTTFGVSQLSQVRFGITVAHELTQQSTQLAEVGNRAGAVEASRRAVEVYRHLTHSSPVHHQPMLAGSLQTLAVRLSEAGDAAGARAAMEEVIALQRPYAKYNARDAAKLEESRALLARIETAARTDAAKVQTAENSAF